MNEQQNFLSDLIEAVRKNTEVQLQLARAISHQADAIADLVNEIASQGDDDDEPQGPAFLGDVT